MKRLICLLLVFVLSVATFCGCNNNENNSSKVKGNIDYSKDMQIYYHCVGDFSAPITKSDKGYYYVTNTDAGQKFIYYIDKGTQKVTPLCSKPNCLHDDPNTCDAYVNIDEFVFNDSSGGFEQNVIQYYDGSLYTICGENDKSNIEYNKYLMKMDADGSNRERITDYFDGVVKNWFIHKGYFYYSTDSSILRVPMDNTKQKPEVVYKAKHYIKDDENLFNSVVAYKNYIYFDVNEKDENGKGDGIKSICVNIDNKKNHILKVNNEKVGFECFNGNNMLLTYANDKEKIYYKADLEGNNPKKILTQSHNKMTTISSDGTYYYSDNAIQVEKKLTKVQIITVYDKNMKEIDTFQLPKQNSNVYYSFTPQDENNFIFTKYDGKQGYDLVLADKSQLGSINGKLINIKDIGHLNYGKSKENQYAIAG